MSKYESFLKLKGMVGDVVRSINLATGNNAQGEYDRQNDKATFTFSFDRLLDASWTPARIHLEMAHGYYGSSSGYNDMSPEAAKYVVQACNALSGQIAKKAIELAQKDLAAAQQEAQAEAKQVLISVLSPDIGDSGEGAGEAGPGGGGQITERGQA